MLLCENVRYTAINMADSCHLGSGTFIPMFKTPLIFLAINSFLEVSMRWFYAWKRMKVYITNFYHHYSLSGLSLAAGRILFRHQVLMQISFFFIPSDAQHFSAKTIMNDEDFCSTHSNYKLTTELFKYGLFQKFSKDLGFHRNQCKMQIMYHNAHVSWCINFQNRFHLFIVHASFFHFTSWLFAKIAFLLCRWPKVNLNLNLGQLKFCSYGIFKTNSLELK